MLVSRFRALGLASLACSSCVAVGCSSDPEEPQRLGTEDRASALASKLEADTGVRWVVRADEATREVRFVMPTAKVAAFVRGSPEETVKELYAKYREELGATDPASELSNTESTTDEDGITHLRFAPRLAGTNHPIFDEASLAHVTKDGSIAFLQPSFRRDLTGVAKEPGLERDHARSLAVTAVADRCATNADAIEALKTADGVLVEPELGVHTIGKPALSFRFRFEVTGGAACVSPLVDVDARSGAILEVRETAATLTERQGGSRFHLLGEHDDKKDIEVKEDNSLIVMTRWVLSASSPVSIMTRRYTPLAIIDDPIMTVTQGVWEPNEPARGASVDAHHYMQITASYYKQVFGRSSYDGKGSSVVIVSHDNSRDNRQNAYSEANFLWMGGRFHFGDGNFVVDGKGMELPYSAGLDIVAHEFTHAVTDHTSKLVYEGESGALNESMSDIFGATIENWNPSTRSFGRNLRIGERIYRDGWGMRDMHAPRTHGQPDHYTKRVGCPDDHCGVHSNSGISNNAWFLMTHGGVNQTSNIGVAKGIGWDESARLWYTTNSTLLYPRATFHHAALAQVGQAWWRGGDYLTAIACAWNAVGVLSSAEVASVGVTCMTSKVGCSSHTDAVVCSDVSAYSAYICKGGSIVGAQYCADSSKRCRSTSAVDPRAVKNADGSLACD